MHCAHIRPTAKALPGLPRISILHCIKGRRPLPSTKGRNEGLDQMVKLIAEKVSAWRRYRTSVRELSRLTDRELADLGLTRGDIEPVARQVAGF